MRYIYININIILMAYCKTAASPLLPHWRYCSLALSHRYVFHHTTATRKPPQYQNALAVGILIIKSSHSHGRLPLIMGTPIPGMSSLYIQTGPWSVKCVVYKVDFQEPRHTFCLANHDDLDLKSQIATQLRAGPVDVNNTAQQVTWHRVWSLYADFIIKHSWH